AAAHGLDQKHEPIPQGRGGRAEGRQRLVGFVDEARERVLPIDTVVHRQQVRGLRIEQEERTEDQRKSSALELLTHLVTTDVEPLRRCPAAEGSCEGG